MKYEKNSKGWVVPSHLAHRQFPVETERREEECCTTDILFRRGNGKVSHFMLQLHPELVVAALSGAIVIRCETMFHDESRKYHLCHPSFEVVPEGQSPSSYELRLIVSEGVASAEWVKTP